MTDNAFSRFMAPPAKNDLTRLLGVYDLNIEWLAGDGSDRSYFRLKSQSWPSTYVLMQLSGHDAEALKKDNYDWINICQELKSYTNIHTPEIKFLFKDYGCLVIEDYGDKTLEQAVKQLLRAGNETAVFDYYQQAFDVLHDFLRIDEKKTESVWVTRAFDQEKLAWEFDFFLKHFVFGFLNIQLSASEKSQLDNEVQNCSKFLADYSHYFTHRDFHSRNIMVCDKKIAIIDFQDARLGPVSYDCVSLIFDSYVPLSHQQRAHLLNIFTAQIADAAKKKAFEDQWRAMLLQRQLKAIGSFAFLTFVKKRGNYMVYVEEALQTILDSKVQDNRWPFLSHDLIEKISQSSKRISHVP